MKKLSLLLLFFLSACGTPAQPTLVLPVLLPTPTAYMAPSYPTAQVDVAAPNQSAGGIDVRMESVTMEGKNLNAQVCFTLPDLSDWGIFTAHLTYGGGITLAEFGTTLASLQEPTGGGVGLRCDVVTFIVPPDADLTHANISIDSIGATPRADDYCALYMPKIQQELLERGIGITLACVDVNGVQTMQIAAFPPEMSQQQAEEIVYSSEFFAITGPWTFDFELSQ